MTPDEAAKAKANTTTKKQSSQDVEYVNLTKAIPIGTARFKIVQADSKTPKVEFSQQDHASKWHNVSLWQDSLFPLIDQIDKIISTLETDTVFAEHETSMFRSGQSFQCGSKVYSISQRRGDSPNLELKYNKSTDGETKYNTIRLGIFELNELKFYTPSFEKYFTRTTVERKQFDLIAPMKSSTNKNTSPS